MFVLACFCVANGLVAVFDAVRRSNLISQDLRSEYPNYRNSPWAATHFRELFELETEYRSYVGWRRKPYNGTTINIDPPYGIRRSAGQQLSQSYYFLGGSTIWGTGANDSATVPSFFYQLAGLPVLNLGESGYTTRQSLEVLLNLLSDGHRPLAVVSYEGVNDITVHCKRDVRQIPTHDLEQRVNNELQQGAPTKFAMAVRHFFLFVPSRIKTKLAGKIPISQQFNCSADLAKRKIVAQNIVENWKFMQSICLTRGIQFYSVLQPTLFSSRSSTAHLPSEQFELQSEYDAVYAVVRDIVKAQCSGGDCGSFIDLSNFDFGDRHVFIDYCHLSPNGNKMIARALAGQLVPQ